MRARLFAVRWTFALDADNIRRVRRTIRKELRQARESAPFERPTMRGTTGDGPAPLPVREFHPTLSEMQDFSAFIARIEPSCVESGAALIHPPADWRPRADTAYSDIHNIILTRPIQQELLGLRGEYLAMLVEKPRTTFASFRHLAEKARALSNPPVLVDAHNASELDAVDRAFWNGALFRTPTYGADLDATLFDDLCPSFNLNRLDTPLRNITSCAQVPGVQRPYLYFGMWGAFFAFHCEDADLYSIKYLHTGSPKTWYTIPLSDRARFEEVCRTAFPAHFRSCDQVLRHKQALLSIDFLRKNGMRFGRVTQTERSFCILFPGVYHAGFNHGLNVAEAVNFASVRWIPMGSRARRCECRTDSATVDAEAIVRALFPGSTTKQFQEFVRKDVYVDKAISIGDKDGEEGDGRSLSCRQQVGATVANEPRYWTRSARRELIAGRQRPA